MRFRELELVRYARFEDCRLRFREGAPDLHVIFGANEAGKSTTLAAISDLLFGFPARTDYAFRFAMPLLRVGAVLEEEGLSFAFRRKKGNKDTVLGVDDKPIDEQPLTAMLHGQERDVFRLSWSLDHLRLREGGKAIVDAGNDLSRTLFAAGQGLGDVAELLSALEKEADAIWGPRASDKRAYTRADRAYTEAKRQLRETQLRPGDWKAAKTTMETADRELAELEERRNAALKELRRIERLRRVLGPVREREALRMDLERMDAVLLPPSLEADAAKALEEAGEAERKRATALDMLNEREQRLAELQIDGAVLATREQIEELPGVRGAIDKALDDLDRLKVRLEASRNRIAAIRADLGLGDAAGPNAKALPSRLAVEELRSLMAESIQLEAGLQGLKTSAAQGQQRRERYAADLAALDSPGELDGLAAAVKAAERLGEIDEMAARQARQVETARRDYDLALERLKPWSGDGEALVRLIVPADGTIDAARAAAGRALDAEQQAAREAADLVEERERLDLQRRDLSEAGQAVSAEALEAARQARDADWQRLKARIAAPEPVPTSDTGPFEAAMKNADVLADHRFASAKESAQLSQIEAQQHQILLRISQAEDRREAASRSRNTAQQEWQATLASLALPALEPVVLRDWLQRRDAALERWDAAQRAQDELRMTQEGRAGAAHTLRAILGLEAAGKGDALAPLLEQARSELQQAEEIRRQRESLTQKLAEADEQLLGVHQQLTGQQAQVSAWRSRWDVAVAQTGLAFPPEGGEARLGILEELRSETAASAELQHRIDTISDDAAGFEARLTELAQRLGEAIQDRRGGEILEALRARLDAAKAANAKQTAWKQEAEEYALAAREAESRLQASEAALAELRRIAGAQDRVSAAEALEASRRRRSLERRLHELEVQIAQLSDGLALDDLIGPCLAADPDSLPGEAEKVQRRLEALQAEIREMASRQALAKDNFVRMDSGERALQASADMQEAAAEMAAQAEAYLLRRAQALTLRWTMERYRERQQNPLLARGSELFRVLTCGRYRELTIDYERSVPRLIGLCDDGENAVGIEAMSDGTVDQLYLALRIAGIEQALKAGVRLPFLADDLFINFDDDRARAGLEVLAELARSTQVLIFTHHAHLLSLARSVVGEANLSVCELP